MPMSRSRSRNRVTSSASASSARSSPDGRTAAALRSIADVEGSVELARQHWAEGYRRVLQTKESEPRLHARLLQQVDAVTGELRRRIGRSFTLGELAAAYVRADSWAYDALEDQAGE